MIPFPARASARSTRRAMSMRTAVTTIDSSARPTTPASSQPAAPAARHGGGRLFSFISARWIVFQLHWGLGITLGLVLALMGITGALMSFEDPIMRVLSPGIVTVAPREEAPLTPDALVSRIQAQRPHVAVTSLTLTAGPGAAARVQLGPREAAERSYVDPYDGRLLGPARGEGFFAFVRVLHRWLALPDGPRGVGRQIAGAAALALLYLSLSGLYLRWPRRPLDAGEWLRLDWRSKGRTLYRSLHAVIGTWVLLVYLVFSLTGLWWTYDWYRGGATWVLTGKAPVQREAGPPRGPGGDHGPNGEHTPPDHAHAAPAVVLDAAWAAFQQQTGGRYASATLAPPMPGDTTIRIRFLAPDAGHDRAIDEMALDSRDGHVISTSSYTGKPLGARIAAAILSVHRGSFFGIGGAVLFMLAALAMPLFTVTGILLYLDRRRRTAATRAAMRAAAGTAAQSPAAPAAPPLWVIHASQTGTAEELAWRTAALLRAAGRTVTVAALTDMPPDRMTGQMLFIASTYGDGEAPDAVRAYVRTHMPQPAALDGVDYAVLALGDRHYSRFCGFGLDLAAWLGRSGARRLFGPVLVDQGDAAALSQWRDALRPLGDNPAAPDTDIAAWGTPPYADWRLVERDCLNPGSPGGAVYHIALEPAAPAARQPWLPGDIVCVQPGNAPDRLAAFLDAVDLRGDEPVRTADGTVPLATVLRTRLLPASPSPDAAMLAQGLADALPSLPCRDYSIASLAEEGRLELLVRQRHTPDGGLGLGSGWLTVHAAMGDTVSLRIRGNPAFHPPESARPMILIGAGTGMAGLRAHLKHRRAHRQGDAWLLFGERDGGCDLFHTADIAGWQADGTLSRVDLAFSRDPTRPEYVQDRLADQAETVRAWVARGAAIYVCGNRNGMAAAVDSVLRQILGDPAVDDLMATGRYRRDVY